MDKSRVRLFFVSFVILALSGATFFLAVQNRKLSADNKTLLASRDAYKAKTEKLASKNLRLFKILAKNSLLVKNADGQKHALEDSLQSMKKEQEAILYEMKKAEAQMNAALEEKTYLEDILIHKTKEIESLKNQSTPANPAAIEAATTSGSDISGKIREKEKQIQTLSEQNRVLSEKMDRLYQVTTSKISEINVAKIALEETVSTAKDKIDEEWNTVNLGSISVDKKQKAPEKPRQQQTQRTGPKTSGKVLAINEGHGFVVVDLGKVDNLKADADLEIVREGRNIASLTVLEMRDVMTACNIKLLQDGQKIQVNDVVQIQK